MSKPSDGSGFRTSVWTLGGLAVGLTAGALISNSWMAPSVPPPPTIAVEHIEPQPNGIVLKLGVAVGFLDGTWEDDRNGKFIHVTGEVDYNRGTYTFDEYFSTAPADGMSLTIRTLSKDGTTYVLGDNLSLDRRLLRSVSVTKVLARYSYSGGLIWINEAKDAEVKSKMKLQLPAPPS